MGATASSVTPWAAPLRPGSGLSSRRAKVRDRAGGRGGKNPLRSSILPNGAADHRALLPVLYLRGVSPRLPGGACRSPGQDARNLSPAVIARLTAEWQADYDAWRRRDLSAPRVYVWADGVYLQARMEDAAECMLVLIGATPEGKRNSSASRRVRRRAELA